MLVSGDVLIIGGTNTWISLSTCNIYNSARHSWSKISNMKLARSQHTATVLPSGKVLVIGSVDSYENLCEIYDPSSDTWLPTMDISLRR